jgi:hypothetical protein
MMSVSRTWIRLSWLASALMALASAAGLFLPVVYAKESASWAAQGAGQDVVNIIIALPVLVISAWYVRKGSVRGLMVLLGALVYVVYSYATYAFFVHFGPAFLLYVATLSSSAFALAGVSASVGFDELRNAWPENFRLRSVSLVLVLIGIVFGAMWLASIARALASGTAPEGVAEIGLPVNPIHVLDLAFVLPLTIVTAMAHWQRRPFGLLFAAPLLVFFAIMDCAIISMTYVMWGRGISASLAVVPMMAAGLVISVVLSVLMLRAVHSANVKSA